MSNDPSPGSTIDPQNPWLGLASFTEETRAYFHGRDQEVGELSRRVQRKLLTVLFGQSGLGKTSILRAGLVPRLRAEGFSPVYVRLDYSAGAPEPSAQIRQLIDRCHERARVDLADHPLAGARSYAPESLWEFFHLRATTPRGASGRPLTPLLIFDQFEEIFTLAQSDEAGRQRAQAFLVELADLAENRPPAVLEAKIERDDSLAAEFDFARADYRILVSLREDYLAHLEGLKAQMPSITQNRLRLARMSGAQALEAILRPGAGLVTEDVARQIVSFVSGSAELATAEVEPSLLSLVCRELNEARRAQGATEISAGLLAGSRDTILAKFYERALADQPVAVRHVIEDALLTDSGFRESVAEERLRKALAAAGAPRSVLDTLVDRRLLRIEERLDVRRVELTHDVLCGIVKASRDTRREREEKEAAEAQLAATRARQAASRQALRRARLVAIGCAALAIVAVSGAIIGFLNFRRTQAAEVSAREAQGRAALAATAATAAETRAQAAAETARLAEADTAATEKLANEGRTKAETLVGFLLDDFYDELAPTGRVETIGALAQQAVAYYDGLPQELRTAETIRNRALALAHQGLALKLQGKEGSKLLEQAVAELEKQWAAGDRSDATALGLAAALLEAVNSFPRAKRNAERAQELLRPLAMAPNSSPRIRLRYVEVLYLRTSTSAHSQTAEWPAMLDEARQILLGLGALDFTNLGASSLYARVMLRAAGRLPVAQQNTTHMEALDVAEKIILRRPGDLEALRVRASASSAVASAAAVNFEYPRVLEWATRAEQAWQEVVRFDPSNRVQCDLLNRARNTLAATLAAAGRISDALAMYRQVVATPPERQGGQAVHHLVRAYANLAVLEADRGNAAEARKAKDGEAIIAAPLKQTRYGGVSTWLSTVRLELISLAEDRLLHLRSGNYEAVISSAAEASRQLAALAAQPAPTDTDKQLLALAVAILHRDLAEANIMLGRWEEAERAVLDAPVPAPGVFAFVLVLPPGFDRANPAATYPVYTAEASAIWHALAVARQGRGTDALQILEPALRYHRDRQRVPDLKDREWHARAWFVHAIAQPDDPAGRSQREASLDEAEKLLKPLSDEAKQLYGPRILIQWIADERAKATGEPRT